MTDQVTETASSPSKETRKKKRVWVIVVGVLVVAALAVGAALLGQHLLTPAAPPPPPKNAAPAASGKTPADFTEFKDDNLGISISYPKAWAPLNPNNKDILLLASNGPEESMLLRRTELTKPIGEQDLPEAKKEVTDPFIGSNKDLQLITQPKQIELGGLPGYFYFYRFKDPASGQLGAHSHYFLFKGKTMISLIFQTVPADQFSNSAPTYDKIANSFHSGNK